MGLVEKIKQVFVRAREGWAIDVYTRVEKDVLKILSSYTIMEKEKLQELADLLKNRPKRKPKGYTDIEKRRAELYTYIAMLDNWAEVLVKKFVEVFGESAKEITTK